MPLEKPYLWKINLGEDGEFAKKPYCAHFCRRSKRAAPNAIKAVYPEAHIQFDYFHILQNIWRKVWDEFRAHRRDLKERGEAAQTKYYSEKLKSLAAKLWKNRYIFFKSEENLSAKEKETMREVLRTQPEMSFLRGFLHKVWAIFEGPTTEAEAQAKLAELKRYVAHQENNGYTKSITFLDDNFKNMTTFLRAPGVHWRAAEFASRDRHASVAPFGA